MVFLCTQGSFLYIFVNVDGSTVQCDFTYCFYEPDVLISSLFDFHTEGENVPPPNSVNLNVATAMIIGSDIFCLQVVWRKLEEGWGCGLQTVRSKYCTGRMLYTEHPVQQKNCTGRCTQNVLINDWVAENLWKALWNIKLQSTKWSHTQLHCSTQYRMRRPVP